MSNILRLAFSVIFGIIIACMVIGLVDALNNHLFPSSIMNPTPAEQAEMIKNSPVSEFLLVLLGYIISAFFGGYAAARISPERYKLMSALFVGFFLLLCGIVYFIIIPQPWWFSISSGISYMLFSYLGAKVGMR